VIFLIYYLSPEICVVSVGLGVSDYSFGSDLAGLSFIFSNFI